MIDREQIVIVETEGYEDEYYWDFTANIRYGAEKFTIIWARESFTDYETFEACIKGEFKRLHGETASCESSEEEMKEIIASILDDFFENDAQESIEITERYTKVDGKVVKGHEA